MKKHCIQREEFETFHREFAPLKNKDAPVPSFNPPPAEHLVTSAWLTGPLDRAMYRVEERHRALLISKKYDFTKIKDVQDLVVLTEEIERQEEALAGLGYDNFICMATSDKKEHDEELDEDFVITSIHGIVAYAKRFRATALSKEIRNLVQALLQNGSA